jgi:hypothetical protein
MAKDWRETLNIASVAPGIERSILGYAGESLVIGRALVCGYNLFFKAWRDSKYDAVLDHLGVLYRLEIKQSRDGHQFSLTSGGRSGAQIDRSADSREQIVSPDDCDFLVAVHSLTATCWVVPAEVIAILGRKSLTSAALSPYEEAWGIFAMIPNLIGSVPNPSQLRRLDLESLTKIAEKLGLDGPVPESLRIGKRTIVHLTSDVDRFVVAIWERIAQLARTQAGQVAK